MSKSSSRLNRQNLFGHCLARFQCSTVWLCSKVINFRSHAKCVC